MAIRKRDQHRNISPIRSVSKEERIEKHVAKLKERINKWPIPLLESYEAIEETVADENELSKIYKVLVKLHEENSEEYDKNSQEYDENAQEYGDLIMECIDVCESIRSFREGSKSPSVRYTPECYKPSNKSPSACYTPECNIPSNKPPITQSKPTINYLLIFVPVIFLILFVPSYYYVQNNPDVPSSKINEWGQNIKELEEKFPSQSEDIWPQIFSGVKTIVTEKPTKPSVFLLLHNHKETSSCLARKVGEEAVKLLSDTAREPIIIQGENLKSNQSLQEDYGLFAQAYKHDIEEKHVMIVLDLQEVPAQLAQTFHVLCDVENPLVHNAAFLFTMQVNENYQQRPTEIAENYLSLLWRDTLDTNIMEALITRITNAVMSVQMESQVPCEIS